MKNLFLSLFMLIFAMVGVMPDAEARRLGGGGSFGMQRQASPAPAPRPPAAAPQQRPSAQPAAATAGAAGRSWMGPVAGLAAGLGLAALFAHLGLGEELASFVMLALLAFGALMLFRMFMRRSNPASDIGGMQYAGQTAQRASLPTVQAGSTAPGGPSLVKTGAPQAGFDHEAFERQAKVQFIRLQTAHDAGNLDDIRSFTTPEVFAEIRLQMAERGQGAQHTDVIDLAAEVVDVAEDARQYIVSVRFTGLVREEPDVAPVEFDEVWHLTKPLIGGSGWVIAGIQQSS